MMIILNHDERIVSERFRGMWYLAFLVLIVVEYVEIKRVCCREVS